MSKIPTNAIADLAYIRSGLATARRDAGMTQEALAIAIGRSRSSVDRFENNRNEPSLYEAAIHARRLGFRLALVPIEADASKVTQRIEGADALGMSITCQERG